ncbi:zinc finger protein 502 isoform X2 [Cryptotermes secundus]|uniref:zinc finger protein 502 isoform X2 n=1 Tax=Cryptotermes secundus TaxID=105785 RepID=UPI000CD7BBE1|nr:zinc finger protein 502 isoform X2 [Cryptotermes secundus]
MTVMDVIGMGPLHPELLIKEEKMFVISGVMEETEFFGRTKGQELASVPGGSIKVEPKEEIPEVKDEVKSEITVEDQAVDCQDMFGPCFQKLVKQEEEEETDTTSEDRELPSPSQTVNPFLGNAQECGLYFYNECAGCFKSTVSMRNECSDHAGSCYELCVNNTKESSCDQVQMNIPVEEFEPKVDTFISDFSPSVQSYRDKPLKMDPIVKLPRLELSAFDMKHMDRSEMGTDTGRLQLGNFCINTDTVSDSKIATVSEFPTLQDVIVHASCHNSVNDSGSMANSFSQHKNEHNMQRAINYDQVETLSKGLLLKQQLEHHASGSSSTKIPKHETVSHKSQNSKHNKIETMESTLKPTRRLSSNYKLTKCLCDCSTSPSVEGKTGENSSVTIGNTVKESKRLASVFELKQHLSENSSASVAEDEAEVARQRDSCEAEQKKITVIPKININSIQKKMQHSRAHIADTPYYCNRCKKQYATSRNLQEHYMFHTGAQPFVCNVCAKMFPTLIQLVKHSHTHVRGQTYDCQLCDKKFRFLVSLKRHILFHTGERPFECILCNRKFFTLLHLKNHIHIHTGEKPYVCRLCWKGFSSPSSLRKHRFHHARRQSYLCKFCNIEFGRYKLFMRHVETHKSRKYECSECHKVFSSLMLVKKHARTHSAVQPYACTLCSSSFSRSTSLLMHYQCHRRFEHHGLTNLHTA